MPARYRLSEYDIQNILAVMKGTRDKEVYRRALCVWMPAALGVNNPGTARALGCSVRAVEAARRRFRRLGAKAFEEWKQPALAMPPNGGDGLRAAVNAARTPEELRGALAVWLRVLLGLSLRQIATALNCTVAFVRNAQEAYLKAGPGALRGGEQPPPLAEGVAAELQGELKRARTVTEHRRALCVFLRAVLDLPPRQVALAAGITRGSVCRLYTDYLRQGVAVLHKPGRGGPRRGILTLREESEMLNELRGLNEPGWPPGFVKFAVIHHAVEVRARRPVRRSSVHAILDRHGWTPEAIVVSPIQSWGPKKK
ncbi:MAG TPA: helix-turn-helix domain-containing protein [Terriglobia bacterium]|nr:helix-turn-helix domain-containing protein [Terriglobia bacterium]